MKCHLSVWENVILYIRHFCIPDSVFQIRCLSTMLIAVFNSILPRSAGVLQAFCVISQQEHHICGIYRTLRRSWSRRVSMTPPRPSSRLILGKYSQCCLIHHHSGESRETQMLPRLYRGEINATFFFFADLHFFVPRIAGEVRDPSRATDDEISITASD